MTIEDETGWANLVVFQNLFDQYRKEIMQSTLIMVEGQLQVEGEVIHVIVQSCHNISGMLRKLVPTGNKDPQVSTFAFPDRSPEPATKTPAKNKEKIFIEARNFK